MSIDIHHTQAVRTSNFSAVSLLCWLVHNLTEIYINYTWLHRISQYLHLQSLDLECGLPRLLYQDFSVCKTSFLEDYK